MDPLKKRKLEENGVPPSSNLTLSTPSKLTPDDARRLIESFTTEQLLDILQTAIVSHPDVLDTVRSISDQDQMKRKLFIRGLGWDTTDEKIRTLFSLYGELLEAAVIKDKLTGKSKGYGFITFKHVDGALLALKEPSKQIDGRVTVTQYASVGFPGSAAPTGNPNPNPTPNPNPNTNFNLQGNLNANRKIYVANVPYDMAPERLLSHFSMYGPVEEGPLGYDKVTGKSRGWTLFVYKTVEGARAAVVDPIKNIDGVQLSCKFAIDWKKNKAGGGPTTGVAQGDSSGVRQQTGSQVGGVGGGLPGQSTVGNCPVNSGFGGLGLGAVGGQGQGGSLGVSGGFGSAIGWSNYGGPGQSVFSGLGGAGGLLGGAGVGLGGGTAAGLGGAGGGFGATVGGLGGGLGGAGGGLGGAGGGLGATGGGLGGAGGGLGSAGGGLGGAAVGSSFYGLGQNSGGIGAGDYRGSAHYSLSSSGYTSQQNQGAGTSPRVLPGGSLQGMPRYY